MRRRHRQLTMVARFVTADATELKLATDVPLGDSYSDIESRSDLILGLATRGRYVKTQKVLCPDISTGLYNGAGRPV